MGSYYQKGMCNGVLENGNHKGTISWLDLRVFYLRISKCEIDSSTPEFLTLKHIPLNHDTVLELNGVENNQLSVQPAALLRRDRVDKKTEEVTFVSTDTLRTTGSVKFEVLQNDVILLSGAIRLCSNNNNGNGDSSSSSWSISCVSDMVVPKVGFVKGSPAMEVYVAGTFSGNGNPFILTKSIQLGHKKKHTRKTMLESIPEYEVAQNTTMQERTMEQREYKAVNEEYMIKDQMMEYLCGEDEELSLFNAGVRVGVGIGLSVCVGLGIGVGLLVKTYQGTTRNFLRRVI